MGFFKRNKRSAQSARERLQLVLIHDRTDLTPEALNTLKTELIAVIARHIDIDPDAVQIELAREGREQRLIADIPLRSREKQR